MMTGTTIVSNAGVFAAGVGWGVSPPSHTTSLLVGTIAKKPAIVGDAIEEREYLCVTIGVDHDIVDGAIAVRFAERFKELIEKGAGVLEEGRMLPAPRSGSVA